jgi:hypothetical protein
MSRFDLTGDTFFLTYSQATTIDEDDIINHLKTLGTLQGFIISEEKHQDGNSHYHCLVRFTTKLRIRTSKFFDVSGNHPNITKPHSIYNTWHYITKESEGWAEGCFSEPPLEPGTAPTKENPWAAILQTSTTTEELLSKVASHDPKTYILYRDRIETNGREHFKESATPIYVPRYGQFTIPQQLQQYLDGEFIRPDRPKTLVLVGPTRLGKTEWARSLGIHMYFNHMFNLDEWNPSAQYMVLDDMDFDFIPAKKAIFFAQKTFTMTDKYRKKRTVNWGKPTIYLCNTEPNWDKHDDPYKDNIIVVYINDKLY